LKSALLINYAFCTHTHNSKQATRKLKKSVQAIIAVNRMSRLLAGAREAAAEVEKEKVDAEESETRAAAETA
jgi:hypothetical protein